MMRPKDVQINLGNVCNNNCVFCVNQASQNRSDFISPAALKERILRYAKKKYTSLGFLGGEPTLYPALADIISYARRAGFSHIHLVTNGRRLADAGYLAALVAAGVTRISVSIHGDTAMLEDPLTRVRGGFRQKWHALQNVIKLVRNGALAEGVSVNIVLTVQNLPHLVRMLKKFHVLGIRSVRVNYCRPEGIPFAQCRSLLPAYAEVRPVIDTLMKTYPSSMLSFEGIPLCIMPDRPDALTYVGELKDSFDTVFAFNKDMPHMVKTFEEFSWKRERTEGLKRKVPQCRACALAPVCEGVYVNYVKLFGMSEFMPFNTEKFSASTTQGRGSRARTDSTVQAAHKAIIKVGYSCNNECLFCHVDVPSAKRKDASVVQIRKKIMMAKKLGCTGVLLSGGEVTIRKDLLAMVRAVKSMGMFFGLVTNGRRLQDRSYAERLVAAGLRYVYMSFMSSDKKVQDRLTGGTTYEGTVSAIRNMVSLPVFFKVNIPLTVLNLPTLESTVRSLLAMGVRRIKFSFVEPKGRALHAKASLVPLISTAWKKVRPVVDRYREKMHIGLDGFPLCIIKGYEDLYDDLFTEHIMYMSEAYEQRLFPTDLGTKIKVRSCRQCTVHDACRGIYAQYVKHMGSGELEPI